MRHGFICLLYFLLAPPFFCIGQRCRTDSKTIASRADLLESIKNDPGKKLVLLQGIPGVVIDLRYGTVANFTGRALYRHPFACLREAPAAALLQVQNDLRKKGLGLKIYDAFRPFSVTCAIWQIVPDRRYAANPRKGSHHNRAIALDLTLIDLKTGKELDMGTAFDNFTDSAHHNFASLPAGVIANRNLLRTIMWQHGFNFVPTEWWHYHWRDKTRYEIIDLDFDDISDLVLSN